MLLVDWVEDSCPMAAMVARQSGGRLRHSNSGPSPRSGWPAAPVTAYEGPNVVLYDQTDILGASPTWAANDAYDNWQLTTWVPTAPRTIDEVLCPVHTNGTGPRLSMSSSTGMLSDCRGQLVTPHSASCRPTRRGTFTIARPFRLCCRNGHLPWVSGQR